MEHFFTTYTYVATYIILFSFLATTQLEDKTNTITDLNHKELNQSSMLEESASAMPKPNEVTMHITKAPATVTDMQTKLEIGQSDKHHTPCMSHLTEVTEVKDINSSKFLCILNC